MIFVTINFSVGHTTPEENIVVASLAVAHIYLPVTGQCHVLAVG